MNLTDPEHIAAGYASCRFNDCDGTVPLAVATVEVLPVVPA